MPRVIRIGVDLSQGHVWTPTICDKPSNKRTVFANGIQVAAVGDLYNVGMHIPPPLQPPHYGMFAAGGSNNVFIDGLPVHRDGDMISCGDVADNGSTDVFANGGGAGSKKDPGETIGYTARAPIISYDSVINIPYVVERETGTYLRGCPVNIGPLDVYTPLEEEETNSLYKNYPGMPLTQRSGADLPSYAPQAFKAPIKISSLSIDKPLPDGIKFNSPNGVIYGSLTKEGSLQSDETFIIRGSNYVGNGQAIIFVKLVPVFYCS